MAGLAAGLLVFTGLWHALEWLMGGRNSDTLRLIPLGAIYVILGCLIVAFTGAWPVLVAAPVVTAAGMTAVFRRCKDSFVRRWVSWAFIVIDAAIIVALLMALFSG